MSSIPGVRVVHAWFVRDGQEMQIVTYGTGPAWFVETAGARPWQVTADDAAQLVEMALSTATQDSPVGWDDRRAHPCATPARDRFHARLESSFGASSRHTTTA